MGPQSLNPRIAESVLGVSRATNISPKVGRDVLGAPGTPLQLYCPAAISSPYSKSSFVSSTSQRIRASRPGPSVSRARAGKPGRDNFERRHRAHAPSAPMRAIGAIGGSKTANLMP